MMMFNIFYIPACDGQILGWFLVLEIVFDIMYSDRLEIAEGPPKGHRLIVLEMSCLRIGVSISASCLIFSVVTLFAKKAQRTHEEGTGKGLQGLASSSSAGMPRAPHRADPHPERLYRRRHRLLWLRTPLK